jgi:hypothetical protein
MPCLRNVDVNVNEDVDVSENEDVDVSVDRDGDGDVAVGADTPWAASEWCLKTFPRCCVLRHD